MEYIILDMEWDSAYFVPEKRFINQILQIGAVKLNDAFDIVDTLDLTIHSSFSKRVSKRFTNLTGITKEMMLSGVSLKQAVEAFNDFAKGDTVVMTWSDSDLYAILDNERMLLKDVHFRIEKYVDLQKYIQNELRLKGHEITSQISLSAAAELLDINIDDYELHTAKDDSTISALLLKKCYNKERFCTYIKDTSNPEFYKRLTFKSYYIKDFESPEIPRETFYFVCPLCGGELKQRSKWSFHNHSFSANFDCKNCDKKFLGRVSARKTFDSVKLRKKILEKKQKEEKDDLQPLPEKV